MWIIEYLKISWVGILTVGYVFWEISQKYKKKVEIGEKIENRKMTNNKIWYKKWWVITLFIFFILYMMGSLISDGDNSSDNRISCKVFRSSGGTVAPYDSSCRPCGDGHTHCTCKVSGSCESGGEGAFQICNGYCIPN
jgi:hypothetical protein